MYTEYLTYLSVHPEILRLATTEQALSKLSQMFHKDVYIQTLVDRGELNGDQVDNYAKKVFVDALYGVWSGQVRGDSQLRSYLLKCGSTKPLEKQLTESTPREIVLIDSWLRSLLVSIIKS